MSLWLLTTMAIGFIACVSYITVVEVNTCLLGTLHNGIAHSEGWGVLMGLLLFLLVAITALRWRRRLLLLLAAFVIAYVGGLVALYDASHAIWGNFRCTY